VVEHKPIPDRAIYLARYKPERCVILQRPQAADPRGGRPFTPGWRSMPPSPGNTLPAAAVPRVTTPEPSRAHTGSGPGLVPGRPASVTTPGTLVPEVRRRTSGGK
jgi:hypothetical protein